MTTTRQNILLITSDQWRGDCLSALDHPCIQTPHYDALIKDGILFRNHYSVCAPCAPARASLLTGLYQQNHRVVRNGTPLDHRHTNLAQQLRAAGYQPTLFGYTDTSLDPRVHSETTVTRHGYENILPGFDEGLLLVEGDPQPWLQHLRDQGYDFANADQAFAAVENYPGSAARGKSFAPPRFRDEHSQTAFLTHKTIEYIDTAAPGWCVHLSYLRPHPPFIATEPWNTRYHPDQVPLPVRAPQVEQEAEHPWLKAALSDQGDWFAAWIRDAIGSEHYEREMRQLRATYYGLISKVDHAIGQLIEYLKATHQYNNTLIVLTADHGELLGDHWLFGKRGYFDSSYHIPLIIRDPQQTDNLRGRIEPAFTESVDVMPTILDTLGLPIPRQCDGRSLLPFLANAPPKDWRKELHWEYDFRDVSNDALEKTLGIEMDECQLNVIRDQHYKYVHFTHLPPLMFDLEKDPQELNNLIDHPDYASIALSLSQKMLSWRMRNDERTLTHIDVSRQGIYRRT